jgi:hypothetical protein
MPGFFDNLYGMVELATCGLEDRIRLLQKGVNKIYCLIMMTAFSKSKLWPDDKEIHQQEAGHRLIHRSYEYIFGKDAVDSYLELHGTQPSLTMIDQAEDIYSGSFGASEIPSWSGEAWVSANITPFNS